MKKSPQRLKLIELRKKFKFTQEQFAIFIRVKQSSYSRYEAGTRYPCERAVKRLKKFVSQRGLKITLDDLIE